MQLIKEILEGLSIIHQQKFIHCDLKPENILLEKFEFEFLFFIT